MMSSPPRSPLPPLSPPPPVSTVGARTTSNAAAGVGRRHDNKPVDDDRNNNTSNFISSITFLGGSQNRGIPGTPGSPTGTVLQVQKTHHGIYRFHSDYLKEIDDEVVLNLVEIARNHGAATIIQNNDNDNSNNSNKDNDGGTTTSYVNQVPNQNNEAQLDQIVITLEQRRITNQQYTTVWNVATYVWLVSLLSTLFMQKTNVVIVVVLITIDVIMLILVVILYRRYMSFDRIIQDFVKTIVNDNNIPNVVPADAAVDDYHVMVDDYENAEERIKNVNRRINKYHHHHRNLTLNDDSSSSCCDHPLRRSNDSQQGQMILPESESDHYDHRRRIQQHQKHHNPQRQQQRQQQQSENESSC
jgi:hypothetical protein